MKGQQRDFQATEGLLKDVMMKQAGSLEKAVLEALMNAVDAGADNVFITLEENHLIVDDDGKGMEEEEVTRYFEQFGLKGDDIEEKEFGKFRMGRGQIFNFGANIWHTKDNILVVNIHEDQTEIPRGFVSPSQESELVDAGNDKVQVDTSGLSYFLAEADSEYDGCRVEVDLHKELEDVEGKANEVRDLIRYIPFVHGVNVELNGDKIFHKPNIVKETDLAWYSVSPGGFKSQTEIYNIGAKVKEEPICKTQGVIISKDQLDVNFARNDILETDEYWSMIREEYEITVAEELVKSTESNGYEKKWLLKKAGENTYISEKVYDVALIPTVTGERVSMSELAGETVAFAKTNDSLAQDAMEEGGLVIIKKNWESDVRDAIDECDFMQYSEAVEENMRYEMSEFDYNDLNKRRRQNFDRAEKVLDHVGFEGEFSPGYSDHMDIWKDDSGKLFVDKRYLKAPKKEFVMKRIPEIVKFASHKGSTANGVDWGHTARRNWWEYSTSMHSALYELLQ